MDGRFGYAPHGLNVGGEPCVWCGGGPLGRDVQRARGASRPEALHFGDGGGLRALQLADARPGQGLCHDERSGRGLAGACSEAPHSWLVAKCRDDQNAVFNNLGCLKRSEIGCNHIREKHQCLASVDKRPFVEVAGFKAPLRCQDLFWSEWEARDQPCVWCGGGSGALGDLENPVQGVSLEQWEPLRALRLRDEWPRWGLKHWI